MRARYKGPGGTGVLALKEGATVGHLFDEIKAKSGIPDFSLKYGWPLKTLDLDQKNEIAASLGLNGETFTIVPNAAAAASTPVTAASSSGVGSGTAAPTPSKPVRQAIAPVSSFSPSPPTRGPEGVSVPCPEREGTLLLRVMPDDNSCLFTAFGGALPNKQLTAPELRKMVAEFIMAHPEEYPEVVLAMPPKDYCKAIQGKDRWGGAIELSIFSDLFDIEICTFDVKGQALMKFGENKESRCILVYSGIHYDRVAFSLSDPPYTESTLPPELDSTVWDTADEEILARTQQLVKQLNDMHYYTDPGEILLRCDVPGCDWMGSGEREGSKHAEKTGHTQLSEIEDNALLRCNAPGCDWLGSGETEAKKHTSDSGHSSLSVIPDY